MSRCTTHHHACDCRESWFKQILAERERYRLALESIRDNPHPCYEQGCNCGGIAEMALAVNRSSDQGDPPNENNTS